MTAQADWSAANQRYLMAELALVRLRLEQHAARATESEGPVLDTAVQARDRAAAAMPAPAALDTLCQVFELSPFERAVVLLCAGMELDGGFAACCAAAQGDSRRAFPTFGLALAALPDAHWSALAPSGPLRRFHLVVPGPGDSLTGSPLRIDERVVHHLAGVACLDERLQGLVEPVALPDARLPDSQARLAQRIVSLWSHPREGEPLPLVHLQGGDAVTQRAIAATACARLGLGLQALRVADLPTSAADRELLSRLWEREAALSETALLMVCEEAPGAEALRAVSLADRLRCPIIVSASEPVRPGRKRLLRLDIGRPETAERQALWQHALGPLAGRLDGQLDRVIAQFPMGLQGVRSVSAEVQAELAAGASDAAGTLLWDTCRAQARPHLEGLAQRIEPMARWEDLVLPPLQMELLRDLAAHVRQRTTVYEQWGFASRTSRGLGISGLFAGVSGTGKTMAAEVLAAELRLDLYRIDLSQVVSKYIGETEKNLRRIFDAAEEGSAILLFDEADALFGKRSEVKDSHDRYANIEVSYLLQRMEAYRGLAILTTNMKDALDTAFLRRLRFIVEFPFPSAEQRLELWRRAFPASTPTEGLDLARLAKLNVAGGHIRNIALTAAFIAADAGEPVRMAHLLRAARDEYTKLNRLLTEAETRGWT
ncbi:ATP-binding protein [Myxococcus sp. RHSTA-1-4]|uniref:ATP-binding protein n=1 Tax=Myxococcus sp. RHSTA-1-4 TaxID=2874601 RepID=UPI001CBEBF35|nr:ATP-binding protein [Myxococcus sp. RHSTA-1-4]MBZ4415589.1 ATP-binding protein [Myxococcus sp. RHSTA-1-4]